jgi:uncharacterized sporulation protein YeaH/YhbH (DUF444 family)
MTTVVDRRNQTGNTASASRRRFLERYKGYAKKAVDRAISGGNVTDIGKGGVDVNIPKGDLSQPTIHHGQGGVRQKVLPGNKEYIAGDRIKRSGGGGGGGGGNGNGNGASEDGEGDDDFVFHISEEEFLNYIFEDLELPNLTAKSNSDVEQTKPKYAGIASQGPFSKLDLPRSRRKKMGRLFAAEKPYKDRILELLGEEMTILSNYGAPMTPANDAPSPWVSRKRKIELLEGNVQTLRFAFGDAVSPEHQTRMLAIDDEIADLRKRAGLIPAWNESTDLRFRFHAPQPVPNTKAVMFCLMDVSGSMSQEKKDNAKIFYLLLYRFLQRHYQRTDIVFIRHHSTAEVVDEKEFFYGTATGGTVVSTALEEMLKVIKDKYPVKDWNIFGAQASDGDNSFSDNPKCEKLMGDIMKLVQGYFYTELPYRDTQQLWDTYKKVEGQNPGKFWMGLIHQRKDIWPLFREFFKKRANVEPGNTHAAAAYFAP